MRFSKMNIFSISFSRYSDVGVLILGVPPKYYGLILTFRAFVVNHSLFAVDSKEPGRISSLICRSSGLRL